MNKSTRDAMPQGLQDYLQENPFLSECIQVIVSGRSASSRADGLAYLLWMLGQVKKI